MIIEQTNIKVKLKMKKKFERIKLHLTEFKNMLLIKMDKEINKKIQWVWEGLILKLPDVNKKENNL